MHILLFSPIFLPIPPLFVHVATLNSFISSVPSPHFLLFRSVDINSLEFCSENWSLFALINTSFAVSLSLNFTSTGLIFFSSLF